MCDFCVLAIEKNCKQNSLIVGFFFPNFQAANFPVINPLRPGTHLCLISRFLWAQKIADLQAHSAAPSAALRACRSAIFFFF